MPDPEPAPPQPLRFQASASSGDVSALLLRPQDAHALLVLGHGAGADMHHSFMQAIAAALADRGVASLRYQFPYSERGGKRPDHRGVLLKTVHAAARAAAQAAGELPLFAGGKSMGGRMSSLAAAQAPLPGVRGLVFLGFPLHPAGRPSDERADHLASVPLPMLFLQGTRDKLAELSLLRPVCQKLAPRAQLHVVEGGDHSFAVLKRSGRIEDEVRAELADAVAAFTRKLA